VRVDTHVHVWDLAVRDQPWTAGLPALRRSFALSDLAPALARHELGTVVLVQTVCVAAETPELLRLAAGDPRVAGVVGWVKLTAPDVDEQLARLRELPGGAALVGIRHQVQDEADPRWLCRADVRRGLAATARAGLVYELLVRRHQLDAVLETAAALPELTFVLDHGGKPDVSAPPSPPWTGLMAALAARPNVAAKLSGLTSEAGAAGAAPSHRELLAGFGEVLLTTFGAERLMFGSDWPVCLLGDGYDATVALAETVLSGCTSHDHGLVFGGSAQRVYGLRR
jgi:L-fuconolactonase